MVILLRIVAALVAALCLALGGAWLAADLYAPGFAREQLEKLGVADVISIGSISLPRPDVARARDIDLRDPKTGEVVAHLDDVELRYAVPGLGGWSAHAEAVVGRGGRVRFSRDADDLGFVRALEHVIDKISAYVDSLPAEPPIEQPGGVAPESSAASEPTRIPSLEFREIEVVLQMPGLPLETLPGCDVTVTIADGNVDVLVYTGGRTGRVLLVFNDHGLKRIHVMDVPVAPAFALFLPEDGELLAQELRPTGVLQFDLEREPDGHVRAQGQLDQASLRPPRMPFPLERSSLPFELDGDRFSLKEARLRFDGGEALTSVMHEPGSLLLTLDVVDARFRADFLDLFPQGRGLTWLRCEDGGNIELHLRIEQHSPDAGVDLLAEPEAPMGTAAGGPGFEPEGESASDTIVRGWGGVLLHRVWIGPTPETQVAVDEVVGSFDLREGELVVRETSGLFADGVVRVRGRLDTLTGDVELNGSVFDADLTRVRHALGDQGPSQVSGSLQGGVVYTGRLGDPSSAHGQGQLSVRGGNLWSIKILSAIVNALSLKKPGTAESHRLEVKFDIDGERIDINDLRLDSSFLSLYGKGRVRHLTDVDIDITPITVPLGPLGDLLEYVEAQLIKVQVRGTISDPKVSVIPIKVVTEPVGAFWGWLTGLFSSDEPDPAATTDASPAPAAAPAGTRDAATAPPRDPP